MIIVDDLPLPANTFLETHEFVGTGARRFFVNQIPALGTVTQFPVISFPIGASLVPLGFAAHGDAAIAGEPICEVNRRPSFRMEIDFIVIDDFNFGTRVAAEVVRVGRAAFRVGVIAQ